MKPFGGGKLILCKLVKDLVRNGQSAVENHIQRQIDFSTDYEEIIARRGPNISAKTTTVILSNSCITFSASVLHLRGISLIQQPCCHDGNALLWNGEIFNGPLYEDGDNSDTIALAGKLGVAESESDILNIFGNIEGPWAFVYFQEKLGFLWFGRDIFGRRSLLWNTSSHSLGFELTSVASSGFEGKEVPCDGIYCLDVFSSRKNNHLLLKRYLYSSSPSGLSISDTSDSPFDKNCEVRTSELRICSPIKVPINAALPNSELKPVDDNLASIGTDYLKQFLDMPEFSSAVSQFEAVFCDAIKRRVFNQPFVCKNCFKALENLQSSHKCVHSSVGILFSGGLDSIVVAAVVDRYLPSEVPIDLLNVAFESRKKKDMSQKKLPTRNEDALLISSFDSPDRITGKQGLALLQKNSPSRIWNFVMVNVTQAELEQERLNTITRLIAPLNTVLDDSIGCAVWFAARGKGVIEDGDSSIAYCSPARVLLVGMGADEQLAGYSRHRVKFDSGGWKAVLDELSLEIDRISSRNLGRDDRIISDHGCEARFPFLDERVVSFLNGCPIWLKANLKYPRGIGEKLLLRLFAFKLGLKGASILPKRAIQFGSRIARCENTKEKGSDVCRRLKLLSVNEDTSVT